MARLPYMNFPFPFYRNYYKPSYFPYTAPITPNNTCLSTPQQITDTNNPDNFDNANRNNLNEKNKSNKYNDDYLFDLFGLKIYNDDILLVSLIYFLYSEGVKDDGLFLVLILLLLS